MAKNPIGRGGSSKLRLEHPATTLRKSIQGSKKRPSGPKPVKIRGDQEDAK